LKLHLVILVLPSLLMLEDCSTDDTIDNQIFLSPFDLQSYLLANDRGLDGSNVMTVPSAVRYLLKYLSAYAHESWGFNPVHSAAKNLDASTL
jgi:hypothetical protein